MPSLIRERRVALNYRVDGSGDDVWLMFNGATLPLEFWDPVAEALAVDSTVVRFDARNAGQTVAEGSFSLLDTAADAAAILDAIDVEAAIVAGHAWGGRAAQVFARDYPHRTRALVVCGTGGQLPAKLPADVTRRLRQAGRARDRGAWEAALAEAYCAPGFARRDPAAFGAIAELLWASPPNTAARWDAAVAPSPSYWGRAEVPTLLLYGAADLNGTPENAADLLRRSPDARLVSIPAAGHFVVREASERVIEAMRNFAAELKP